MRRLPRIGLLGIMQELYDDMIPGITEHQARYAESVAQRLGDVATVRFTRPARNREDVDTITRELVDEDVDGIALVTAVVPEGVGANDLRALAVDVRGRLGARPGVVANSGLRARSGRPSSWHIDCQCRSAEVKIAT